VVARNIDERYVEPADHVLQIVEGKVAGGNHEVRSELDELVGVKPLVHLIGDRQDSRHVRCAAPRA